VRSLWQIQKGAGSLKRRCRRPIQIYLGDQKWAGGAGLFTTTIWSTPPAESFCRSKRRRHCSVKKPWLQGVCLSMLVSSEFTHRIWQPIKPMEVESFLFLAWLLARNIQPHIPVIDRQHQTRGRFTRDAFRCEPQENAYYCPEGKPLHYRGQRRSSGGYLYRSTEAQCRDCPQGRAFLAWWRADSRRRQSGNVNEARR